MKYTLLPVLFLLAGCQHVPQTVLVREVPAPVTTTNSLDGIRFPSVYKAYTVGRRRDAANPAVMQETTVLYVLETPDRWNLQPPTAPVTAPAIPAVVPDPTFTQLPISEQLRQEIQKQQQLSQSLSEQNASFQKTVGALVPAASKAVELSILVQQRQQLQEERLRRLEEGQRPASRTNWPVFNSTNR